MKKNVFSIVLAVVFGFTATASTPIDGEKKEVKASESTVVWKGYKVTGSHAGTIALKEGSLLFDGNKLTGGEFVIDMTTLATTDEMGDMNAKLNGHLKSDDFFGVEAHPTATLVITKTATFNKNSYTATGDLSIKGTTKPITFVISIYGNKATATLKIDRTKYDIKYGSGSFFDNLGDKAIYDEFDLVVDLAF